MAGELAQGHWKQAAIASIGLLGVGAGVKLAMNAGKFDKIPSIATALRSISPFHGKEFNIRNVLRVKPLGYWKGGRIEVKLRHFHSRNMHAPTGRSGIKWHRPWQTTFRRWFK